ncbi:MAG: carboxylating nicotinate-nucleotide diphosphorylase [Gammaproteobacteria bacterium]|nr:carboxylating nicotinate-nucleotide diphosphorylase [Gammaproteobacteria bacterium]
MDHVISDMVRTALAEDLGTGDVTAALIANDTWTATLFTREAGVLCGQAWFGETFRQLDPGIRLTWHANDGERLKPGAILCQLRGPARALLSGERTALNFLQTLSGTATAARRYADAVAHTRARILDTRKTLPGLRLAQKYAVRCGGCGNHRMGLYDGVLIKENHIAAAGSLSALLRRAHDLPVPFVEIEVETLVQLSEALEAGGQRILLDNFTLTDLRAAVALSAGRAQLEASGGITLDNVAAFAETGVDFISIGDITKNVRALDLSLRFTPAS